MRLLLIGLCLVAGPALAQQSPPLQAYEPPPSASPLAPLAGAGADAADDKPTGDVRASSNDASNISSADTRSNIAPALPAPAAGADTAEAYLAAARSAIQGGRTGEAQEALERAESRALDRDVAPSEAGTPAAGGMIQQIGDARQALSVGNPQAAIAAIDAALR